MLEVTRLLGLPQSHIYRPRPDLSPAACPTPPGLPLPPLPEVVTGPSYRLRQVLSPRRWLNLVPGSTPGAEASARPLPWAEASAGPQYPKVPVPHTVQVPNSPSTPTVTVLHTVQVHHTAPVPDIPSTPTVPVLHTAPVPRTVQIPNRASTPHNPSTSHPAQVLR